MTYIDNLKYEHIIEDTDSHFSGARIIHHECRDDPLQNFKYYYKTIFNNDFNGYEDRTHNQVMSSTIKAERDDIHFEGDLLKSHIKSDIKKDLISNCFL